MLSSPQTRAPPRNGLPPYVAQSEMQAVLDAGLRIEAACTDYKGRATQTIAGLRSAVRPVHEHCVTFWG